VSSKPQPASDSKSDAKAKDDAKKDDAKKGDAAKGDAAKGGEAAPVAAPAKPKTKFQKMLAHAANSWQAPLLVVGTIGIAAAIHYRQSAPPVDDFEGALAQAEELIADGEFKAARVVLFGVVAPNLETAPPELLPRFHATTGDYIAAQLRGVEFPAKENDDRIIEAYEKARDAGWALTSEQVKRYTESLVRVGRMQDAISLVASTGDSREADELKRRVRRDALLGILRGEDSSMSRSAEALLAAIDEFRADPSLPAAEEAWAIARATEIRLGLGRMEDAANRLLLDLRRLEGASDAGDAVSSDAFAELSGLLGEALRRQGRFAEAKREFEHASTLVTPGTAIAGMIDIGLGRTLVALNEVDAAHGVFERAVKAEHAGRLRQEALLGRGLTHSLRGETNESLRDFQQLRELVWKQSHPDTVREIETVLISRADSALANEQPALALSYADLASTIRPNGGSSAESLLRVATAAREEALRMLGTVPAGTSVDPEDRARINRLLRRAGDSFAAHAAAPEVRSAQDGTVASSLWAAADSYDLAGWRDAAVANFQAYIDVANPDDPRRAEGFWRIAGLSHAEGAFDDAVRGYQAAIAVSQTGPFAVRSVVPMARALASGGRGADALGLLQRVLDGDFGLQPSANEYFDALDVLARLSFERGDFVKSVETLREALLRRPDDPRSGELRFRLGEGLVEVARAARKQAATGDVSVARRMQLSRDASDRLVEARRAFDQSIAAFEKSAQPLDGLGTDMLRRAYLARANTAFDLEQFEEAISLYEIVDRKYPDHALSMVALIQIVNACDRIGDATRAEIAHRRAQLRLAQLPDEAFLVGGGILARESWETWLRNRPPAGRVASNVNSPTPGTGQGGVP
jgi:tetratricopeptide (TPR) repeat protein